MLAGLPPDPARLRVEQRRIVAAQFFAVSVEHVKGPVPVSDRQTQKHPVQPEPANASRRTIGASVTADDPGILDHEIFGPLVGPKRHCCPVEDVQLSHS